MSKLTLEITDIAHGGLGVARDNNRVVFVRGVLPGETVEAEIVKERSKWARAVVTSVLNANEHRSEPLWPEGIAGATGAADFSHAELSYQRELKTTVLHGALRRVGGEELVEHLAQAGIDPKISAVDTTDGWHTRTRADLVKMSQGFGMYREQSHDLIPLTELPLVVPDLAETIFDMDWDRTFKPGHRVHFVAPSTGENVAVSRGKAYAAPRKRVDNQVQETVVGQQRFYDYRVAADGFWQVHFRAPAILQREVVSQAQAQAGQSVLELFSGAGLFSVPLARAVGKNGKFLGLEGVGSATADAQHNLGGMPWAKARTEQLAQELPDFDADVIVADPPRSGLGVGMAQEIADSSASRIVLVSCDPAAAARDIAIMVAAGRRVVSMRGFDIFPHTHHMEIITALV